MRRADRLFQIVQHLRRGRLITAAELAGRLEVSERTIYRDMRDLMLSGVPVEGEAGVGYILRQGFDMPPLMFSRDEIEALVIGARMVQAWGGTALAEAAAHALDKIQAVVPDARRQDMAGARLFAPAFDTPNRPRRQIDQVREAINLRRVIAFDYTRLGDPGAGDGQGAESSRVVRPLGLYFWGQVWTLAAWCELRDAFRTFRVDRMREIRLLDRTFEEIPGRALRDYLRQYGVAE